MKYIYKILRLFLCPHKYRKTINDGYYARFNELGMERVKNGSWYDKECCYCGKIKRFGYRY